jgi:hypothetical protein
LELISILRVLRRHRLLVGAGVALAVFVAMLASYQVSFFPPKLGSRVKTSGTATARVIGAGLKPGEVGVMSPVWSAPKIALPLPVSATEAAGLAREPYLLTVSSTGDIPIITLKATGPDALRAATVVNSGITAIGGLIAARSKGRPEILVERLGPAVARTTVAGPRKAVALAGAFVVLGMWCAGIVVLEWFVRRRLGRGPRTSPAAQYSPSS